MRLENYYFDLYNYVSKPLLDRIEVTTEQLADALCCTKRNMRMILHKLSELQWIDWEPGNGRGNRSLLQLKQGIEEIIIALAEGFLQKGEFQQALEIVAKGGGISNPKLAAWYYSNFGMSRESEEDEPRNMIRFPFHNQISVLDPAFAAYSIHNHIVSHLFDTLVRYDSETNAFKPHLAYAWTNDDEGIKWTFYLRKRVTFHHGREMKADDVVYSFLRLRQTEHRWLVSDINNIVSNDPFSIEIELKQPNYMLPHFLAMTAMSVVPKDVYSLSEEERLRHPIGSGPFRIKVNNEKRLVMEAFDHYFGERPILDQVDIWIVPDLIQETSTETGDIDLFMHGKRDDTVSDWPVRNHPHPTSKMLVFNMIAAGSQSQIAFRKAVIASLDFHSLQEHVGKDVTFSNEVSIDRNKISALLKESAYDGSKVRVRTYSNHVREAEWLSKCLSVAGVDSELSVIPIDEFFQEEALSSFDLAVIGHTPGEDIQLSKLLFFRNIRRFQLEEIQNQIDLQLTAIMHEPDQAERDKRFLQLTEQIECNHFVRNLYDKHIKTRYNPSLKGVSIKPNGWFDFRTLWFK